MLTRPRTVQIFSCESLCGGRLGEASGWASRALLLGLDGPSGLGGSGPSILGLWKRVRELEDSENGVGLAFYHVKHIQFPSSPLSATGQPQRPSQLSWVLAL